MSATLTARAEVISYVDTGLSGSQKYVLRVEGKPFYMINIQIRIDNMRYTPDWTPANTDAVIARAAADGFNTVCIPLHWREVEPEKDRFNWDVVDEYLACANRHNLKLELLWFGTNSGGHVQWLGSSDRLRTPDYVLYSPGRESKSTTSEYTINRKMSPYSLDLADNRLRERETTVLRKVMAHITAWDKANNQRHPLIGIQIGNEVVGYGRPYPNSLVISYLSDVASAVKQSDYVVWTRVNSVFWKIPARIYENELKRNSEGGTNIDFIGIDTYRHHFRTDADFMASMRSNVPYIGKNYRMIMETNSGVPYAAQMHLAALSGNNAFDYYDFSALYNPKDLKPQATNLEDIRLVNKILRSDLTDIALNAQGYGLFVHNHEGVNAAPSINPSCGVAFVPNYPTSQGISITRNDTEIVLMTTKGGTFIIPDSIEITDVSKGYFNPKNQWVKQEVVTIHERAKGGRLNPLIGSSLTLSQGTTLRLIRRSNNVAKPTFILQAESATLGGGAETEAAIEAIGFAGNGYVKLPSVAGVYITWENVDGQGGEEKTLRLRYSNGGYKPARILFEVNGIEQYLKLPSTGSWSYYQLLCLSVTLNKGKTNTIKIETADNTIRKDRVVYYQTVGNIDELQIQ
jgi:GH35 family endo-1,4-beta-xylanase